MWDAFAMVLGLRAVELASSKRDPVVPEPEFKRFVFPRKDVAAEVASANSTRSPRTLQELGVPAGFAAEIEASFRALGAVEGDRVVGFTFRTPDGTSYSLRAGTTARGAAAGKAA
jgi:hypothetical protein